MKLPAEYRSLRHFIWGDCDPYSSLPSQAPGPECQGWHSDHPIFETVISKYQPRLVAEVGSMFGASAIHMGNLLLKHQINAEMICVDTFLGGVDVFFEFKQFREEQLQLDQYHFFDRFLGNVKLSGLTNVITPCIQTSMNAARIFERLGVKFDLIYLDASHEYKDVLADLQSWFPLLNKGGVLIGDDFEEPWFDVIRAALEFADQIDQKITLSKAFASSPYGGRENTKFLFTAP